MAGRIAGLLIGAILAASAAAQSVPIVQPGAPGAAARILTPEQAAKVAETRFIGADIEFMQAMIHHHRQAVDMAELAPSGTADKQLLAMAERILASQRDEIKFMTSWLAARGATAAAAMPTGHHQHGAVEMAGMASPQQMARLRAAKGRDFDRLFLQLMTAHHAGALTMVEELLERPGAAYDPVLFQFTSDLKNEQTAEIKRMDAIRATLSGDPRGGSRRAFAAPARRSPTSLWSPPCPSRRASSTPPIPPASRRSRPRKGSSRRSTRSAATASPTTTPNGATARRC